MQTIWSRAAQSSCACKCTACLSNPTAVIRRASLVTARRLLKPTPSATFVYSAIFAAAVVADSKVKQRRREQWDIVIAEAKTGISNPSNASDQIKVRTSTDTAEIPSEDKNPGTYHEVVTRRVSLDTVSEKENEEAIDRLLAGSIKWPVTDQALPVVMGRPIRRGSLPPQSIYISAHGRAKADARLWTPKKIRVTEVQVALLATQLLADIDLDPQLLAQEPDIHPSIVWFLEKPRRIQKYRGHLTRYRMTLDKAPPDLQGFTDGAPSHCPGYEQDDSGRFRTGTRELNRKVFELFKLTPNQSQAVSSGDKHIEAMFTARLCSALFKSSAPPDLWTWNTLLRTFRRLGKPDLVDHVINGVHFARVRPNEITCSLILGHYTERGDAERFSDFVAKIRAAKGNLMLARPDCQINSASERRLIRVSDEKVLQKLHATPMVFNSILTGLLRFAGFRRTLEIHDEMKNDGWGLDLKGLRVLLSDCCNRQDWVGGRMIWQAIMQFRDQALGSIDRHTYKAMLYLCKACEQKAAFDFIVHEAARAGITFSVDDFDPSRPSKVSNKPKPVAIPHEAFASKRGPVLLGNQNSATAIEAPLSLAAIPHRPLSRNASQRHELVL